MNTKIVAVTGKARSGKDTIADHLCTNYNFIRIAFADRLKYMLSAMLNISIEELNEIKDKHIPGLASPRHMLQTLGTEWGRQMVSTNIWIHLLDVKVKELIAAGVPGIVISDCRFNNEAAYIAGLGGEIWQVDRFGVGVSEHESEKGLDERFIDFFVINDGDKEELYDLIDTYMEGGTVT